MRLYWLIVLSFAVTSGAGQTFFPIPDPVLEKALAYEQANECYLFMSNPGGDTLQLRWKRMEAGVPAGWVVDLCDLGACYVGIPAGGLMAPAFDTVQPYLKLIVQPGSIPGSSWFWFRVWEDGNPENARDLYFSLYTSGTTATQETPGSSVRIFPNPTSGLLFLENIDDRQTPAQLRAANGTLLWSGDLSRYEIQSIDLTAQPPGLYFLHTNPATQTILLAR